jgi:hypothetical protein
MARLVAVWRTTTCQPAVPRHRTEQQPSVSRSMEQLMMWLAIASLLVAVAAFVRDLVAG